MTTTLQQALLKAGLVKEKKDKPENKKAAPAPIRRAAPPSQFQTQKPGFLEGKHHHHLRTHCDACQKSGPDVEYYEHRNRLIENKKWLCVKCADEYKISDDCRQTLQSQFSMAKTFRRNWGPTKIFK